MYLYAELWNFRPAWLALTPAERSAWMTELVAGIGAQIDGGVEPVGFAINDADAPHRSGYDWLAVWKMPDLESVERFEAFVETSGLHQYFEQVNTRGASLELDAMVAALVDPGTEAPA